MKKIPIIFMSVCLLILVRLSGFFYHSDNLDAVWLSTNTLFRWKIYNIQDYEAKIFDNNKEYTYYLLLLQNDEKSYTLSWLEGYSLLSWTLWIMWEFQNIFWKKFYLHYLDPRFEEEYISYKNSFSWGFKGIMEKPFRFTIDPSSNQFKWAKNTACDLLWLSKKCFYVGKLKKWIIMFTSPLHDKPQITLEIQ